MAWPDGIILPYCTVVGKFGLIIEDRSDEDFNPDVTGADGSILFTPNSSVFRHMGAFLYVAPVKASVSEGILVDSLGEPGVNLMATDLWKWNVTLDLPGIVAPSASFYAVENSTVDLVDIVYNG